MATATQTSMNLKHLSVANTLDALSRGRLSLAPAFFAGRPEESGRPPGF